MHKLLHAHSPFRIFAFSGFTTIAVLVAILLGLGIDALVVTAILVAVEIAFSFENAVINAKLLGKMSPFWQKMFLSVGIIVAIFGMRVVFPILIVSLSANLSWASVFDLAVHHPAEYAEKLEHAHPVISAFGGSFLLMLTLSFFLDGGREITWFTRLERPLQKIARRGLRLTITLITVGILAALPFNPHPKETLVAGAVGALTFVVIQEVARLFEVVQKRAGKGGKNTGWAALWTFLYLEVLDASFSFDGVIGAFAITNDVLLIAAGLGIGAIWVRSLTVFMVRRGTLESYIYLEHGAHYTVAVLAGVLLLGIFWNIPEVFAGLAGIGLIGASVLASRQALAQTK